MDELTKADYLLEKLIILSMVGIVYILGMVGLPHHFNLFLCLHTMQYNHDACL
jgi:hypothetical protein